MTKNTTEISGKAAAVIIGALLIIMTFSTKLGWNELWMWILGIILIYFGIKS